MSGSKKINENKVPPISRALVEHLESVFKNPIARPGQSKDKIMHEAGKAYVARWLREQYEQQEKHGLSLSGSLDNLN